MFDFLSDLAFWVLLYAMYIAHNYGKTIDQLKARIATLEDEAWRRKNNLPEM
jgi:hypothetical protein